MKKISVEEVFLSIKDNFFDEKAKYRLKKLNLNEQVVTAGKKCSGQ